MAGIVRKASSGLAGRSASGMGKGRRPGRRDASQGHFRFIRLKRAPGLEAADMLIPLGGVSSDSEPGGQMSTSLLDHAFGIRSYQFPRSDGVVRQVAVPFAESRRSDTESFDGDLLVETSPVCEDHSRR
jgi:hypothetical protein